MDTSTLQMALIGYQAQRHKIEEKIAEIRAQLNGGSWSSRQASSSFSKADHGYATREPRSRYRGIADQQQAKYQMQWIDGRCIQRGKQRNPDSAVYCPGCRTKNRVKARERERRASNAKRRRNLWSISYRESGAVT